MTEILLSYIEKNNTELAVCGLVYHALETSTFGEFPELPCIAVECVASVIPQFVTRYFLNSVCNKLFLKKFITVSFVETMSLGEDLIFNFEYMRNIQRISISAQCLVHYSIQNTQSLTGKVDSNRIFDTIEVYKQSLAFYSQYGCEENLKESESLCKNTLVESIIVICCSKFFTGKQKDHIREAVFCDQCIRSMIFNNSEFTIKKRIILWCIEHR